jgi:hypothetical protein
MEKALNLYNPFLMKPAVYCLLFLLLALESSAQQLARGRNVQLVSQPNTQLVVRGGITFTGTTNFNHRGTLTLFSNPIAGNSDWLDSTSGVFAASSIGHVLFRGGSSLQQVYGPTTFDSVTIQNIGVNLRQSNEVRRWLGLINGLVYFTNVNDSIYVSNPAIASINFNGDPTTTSSWVHGKLSRRLNQVAPTEYEFPIGKIKDGDSLYAPVRLIKDNTVPATWSAQYFPEIPFDRNNINVLLHHISAMEYWTITSHNFPVLADNYARLSLSWRTYSVVSPIAAVRDSLTVAHYYDDAGGIRWNPEPALNLPALNNTAVGNVNWGWLSTNTSIGDFTMPHLRFTLGTRSINNPLPVEFLKWNVVKVNNKSLCTWEIFDDRDVNAYVVERSADGVTFSQIGTVSSAKVPDTKTYNFTDNTPLTGWNYYRVKAVGLNYSKYTTIKALYYGANGDWLLFPNPATDHINVFLPSNVQFATLRLYDVNGRLISQRTMTGNAIVINVASLPGGPYYLEFTNGAEREVKSFIKQ